MASNQLQGAVDVVIVNYNAGHHLKACLESLRDRRVNRVVVVDNASSDNSLDGICPSEYDFSAVVIRNERNLGFATACNIGIKASSAPNILFLNPDCSVTPLALERLLQVFESADSIGMVGGMLCHPDGLEQRGGRRVFPTPRSAFIRAFGLSRLARLFPRYFSDFLLHKEPLPEGPVAVDAISGACMLVKRSAIDEVGLWDEGYFLHCEDLDWCMRFREKGFLIVFVPDARIFHQLGACSRTRPIFVEWHKHRGMLRYYRKFFRDRYSAVMWGAVVVGVWLRFALVAARHGIRRFWQ